MCCCCRRESQNTTGEPSPARRRCSLLACLRRDTLLCGATHADQILRIWKTLFQSLSVNFNPNVLRVRTFVKKYCNEWERDSPYIFATSALEIFVVTSLTSGAAARHIALQCSSFIWHSCRFVRLCSGKSVLYKWENLQLVFNLSYIFSVTRRSRSDVRQWVSESVSGR